VKKMADRQLIKPQSELSYASHCLSVHHTHGLCLAGLLLPELIQVGQNLKEEPLRTAAAAAAG